MMKEKKRYLKTWQYFTVGAGNAGMVLTANFITNFYILFTTDYMGLNSVWIGTLMLVAKLFDGVTDLVFGFILDRGKNKRGKARPWIFRSAVPLSISAILMFFVPDAGGSRSICLFLYFLYAIQCGLLYGGESVL